MPYVPIKNGPSIWIDDEEEARKKYQESWGVEPEPREFDAEINTPNPEKKKTGIFEPVRIVANTLRSIPDDLTAITQKTLDTGRLAGIGPDMGGATHDYRTKPGSKGMEIDYDDPYNSPEAVEERRSKRLNTIATLNTLGVRPDAGQYGIQKDFPVLGALYSKDSKFVQDWIIPRSGFGRFTSDLATTLLPSNWIGNLGKIDKVGKLAKRAKWAPAAWKGFRHLWRNKASKEAWKHSFKSATYFLVKDIAPNAVEDVVWWQPDQNPQVVGALEAIRDLPADQREAAVAMLMSKTDTEFDYNEKALAEVVTGAVSVATLRVLLRAGNRILRAKAEKNLPPARPGEYTPQRVQETNQKIDEIIEDESPALYDAVEQQQLNKLSYERDSELGKTTTKFYNQVDDLSRELSEGGHAVGETIFNRELPELDRLGKAVDDLDAEYPTKMGDLPSIKAEIDELKSKLQLTGTNPEELSQEIAFRKQIFQTKIDEYRTRAEEDPVQFEIGKNGRKKQVKGTGWLNKRSIKPNGKDGVLNKTLLRGAEKELEELELLESRSKLRDNYLSGRSAAQAELDEAVQGWQDIYGVGQEGFRKYLAYMRKRLSDVDTTNKKRVELVNDKNGQANYEGRLEDIDDPNLNDAFDQSYQEIEALISEFEAKTDIQPDEIKDFIRRADEIHNRVLESGGQAPTVMRGAREALEETKGDAKAPDEVEGGKAAEEADKFIPEKKYSVENEADVKLDDDGNPVIDTDQINADRASQNPPSPENQKVSLKERTKRSNDAKGQFKEISNAQDLEEAAENIVKQVEEAQILAREDAIKGSDLLRQTMKWHNTNILKYADDENVAGVLKRAVELLGERGLKINQFAVMEAYEALVAAANAPTFIDALITKGGEYSENVKAGLSNIIVLTSMLKNNSIQLLKASRDLREIRDAGGNKDVALQNFQERYYRLMGNVKVVSQLFEGFGTGLRLFARNNRVEFLENQPQIVENALGDVVRKWGVEGDNFADKVAEATQNAEKVLKTQFDDFFEQVKAGDDSEELWEGIDNLVQRVYESQGDLTKLKELEVTGPELLRRVQSAGMISNPQTVFSIPLMAIPELTIKQIGITASGYANAAFERFVKKNTPVADEAFKAARLEWETLAQLRFAFGEAYDSSLNRFLFGRSIADPGQFNRAYELTGTGLKREDKILQDLSAKQMKIPFTNYILHRGTDEQNRIFDTLNKTRVFFKVFHDYAVVGEAWNKRSMFSKWLLAPSVSAQRNLPGRLGEFGQHSYYGNGDVVNMTLPFQLAAVGDEFTTAWYANGRIRALAEIEIDEKMVAGELEPWERADALKQLLSKKNKDFYAPVTAGIDQKVIGHTYTDTVAKQIQEITRAVNRTEELTGIFKATGDLINSARYNDKHPFMAAFANTMAGVVTSPLNSIKWGIRYGLGTDIWQAGADVGRLGVKTLGEHLPEQLQKRVTQNKVWRRHLTEFESKYFSEDIAVRSKAQGALAVAAGMHTMVFFQMRDPNLEITGGLENTWRSEQGQVGLFTMKINTPFGPWRMPYRWIPIYGNVMALQATMRDIEEFGMNKGWDLMGAVTAATANYIMETPGLASFDRFFKAVSAAGQGDTTRLSKFLSQSFAGSGEPYLQFRKFVTEAIDPRKPADLGSKFQAKQFWTDEGSVETGFNMLTQMGLDTFGSLAGFNNEYTALGFLTDEIVSIVKNHPEGRSRRALYYGEPGETINASHSGWATPFKAVFGRFMPTPDKLDDDVKYEMVINMIQPPRGDLFSGKDYGIRGVNKTVLNDFNHFLNSELRYYDPITKKTYIGMHAALKDLINSKEYKSLPSLDSPYASSGYSILPGIKPWAPEPPNWDASDNTRRTYLANYVRSMINKAKEDFIMGTQEGQQYKASPALKEAVLKHRRGPKLLRGFN